MEHHLGSLHALATYAAVVLRVVGPVVALIYGIRVERRDFWRLPLLAVGILTFVAVIGVWALGRDAVADRPRLLGDPLVLIHLDYAQQLVLPTLGFMFFAMVTALLNARTGALRIVLPWMSAGFGVVVLGLTVLSHDAGARLVVDQMLGQF